jgi:hypothetical protein
MRARLLGAVLLVASMPFAASLTGCGGVYYAAAANGAAARVAEARELGAEQLAPYEYYYAKAHLEQASIEASEASYGDAANYAEIADEYANKAIELSQTAHKAGGRE